MFELPLKEQQNQKGLSLQQVSASSVHVEEGGGKKGLILVAKQISCLNLGRKKCHLGVLRISGYMLPLFS